MRIITENDLFLLKTVEKRFVFTMFLLRQVKENSYRCSGVRIQMQPTITFHNFMKEAHRRPLRKLWNVIADCHGCNPSMHFSKSSAVNARFSQKKRLLLYTLAQFRPLPTSISKRKSKLLIFAQFGALCLSFADLQKQISRVPLKKFPRTALYRLIITERIFPEYEVTQHTYKLVLHRRNPFCKYWKSFSA